MEDWFQEEERMSGVAENLGDYTGELDEDGRNAEMRTFDSGATRDSEEGKADYEGFLSPLVITRFGQYMDSHRQQPDGESRPSDNWQRGMPLHCYIKSGFRHFLEWWRCHREWDAPRGDKVEEALCALLFNVQGYLHVLLEERARQAQRDALCAPYTPGDSHLEATPSLRQGRESTQPSTPPSDYNEPSAELSSESPQYKTLTGQALLDAMVKVGCWPEDNRSSSAPSAAAD